MNSTREDERLIAGIRYLLPGNFMSQAWIDDEGEARIMLDRELMLTPRLGIFGEVEYDTLEDWSYQAGLTYAHPIRLRDGIMGQHLRSRSRFHHPVLTVLDGMLLAE